MIGDYAIGQAAIAELVSTGAANYSISATAGSYAISGQAATIQKTRIVVAANGTYAYTGQAATLVRGRVLTAVSGSYAISGQTATLLRSRKVTAVAGSYAIGGQTATLLRSKKVTASAGSYAISGQAATLLRSKLVLAANGAYTIAGQAATIDISGGSLPVADPFAKWTPFKLACRYRVLQQGTLKVGNTRQNTANLLAMARAEADSPSNPPWARWRTAVNSPHITANLLINVPRVPGFIPSGGYFGRMWDWITKYLKGVA